MYWKLSKIVRKLCMFLMRVGQWVKICLKPRKRNWKLIYKQQRWMNEWVSPCKTVKLLLLQWNRCYVSCTWSVLWIYLFLHVYYRSMFLFLILCCFWYLLLTTGFWKPVLNDNTYLHLHFRFLDIPLDVHFQVCRIVNYY